MKHYEIKSTKTGAILFQGQYPNFNACLEDAISSRIPLPYANLQNRNLSNANFDDAILPHADFSGSNLTGTNLSESYLKGAIFAGAALYNTCMSHSNLRACDFTNASFGATDIAGTIISQSQFSTLSCFSLDFTHVRQMDACIFIGNDGRFSTMSKPPIVIKGLTNKPVILMDYDIRAGHNTINATKASALAHRISMREIRRRFEKLSKSNTQTNRS